MAGSPENPPATVVAPTSGSRRVVVDPVTRAISGIFNRSRAVVLRRTKPSSINRCAQRTRLFTRDVVRMIQKKIGRTHVKNARCPRKRRE